MRGFDIEFRYHFLTRIIEPFDGMYTKVMKLLRLIQLMMFTVVLVAPVHSYSKTISRNIASCQQIEFNDLISNPEGYLSKVICFEGKLLKEAGVYLVVDQSDTLNEQPGNYSLQLAGSIRADRLLDTFETGTSLFIKGEIDVDEFNFDKNNVNRLTDEVIIFFEDFTVFIDSPSAADDTTKINDYYTFNINECMFVELKEIFAAPLAYDGKKICGYETLKTNSSGVFLFEDIEIEHDNFFNEELIMIDALHNEYMFLHRHASGKKMFYYGVLDLHKACWGIGGVEKAVCAPRSKPIDLLYPNIIFLENTK